MLVGEFKPWVSNLNEGYYTTRVKTHLKIYGRLISYLSVAGSHLLLQLVNIAGLHQSYKLKGCESYLICIFIRNHYELPYLRKFYIKKGM